MMMVHVHKGGTMAVQTRFCTIMYSLIIFNNLICSFSNRFIKYIAIYRLLLFNDNIEYTIE
jgi:hypothetical protein